MKQLGYVLLDLILAYVFIDLLLNSPAFADDCNRYLKNIRDLSDINQALMEDCMRTGQAQAWATAVVAAIGGAAIAGAAARALNDPARAGESTQEEVDEKVEKRSRLFRMRVWSNFEAEIVVGIQRLAVEIQQWDPDTDEWGSSRVVSLKGVGLGVAAGIGGAGSASDVWTRFNTDTRMSLDDFGGFSFLVSYPSFSIGPWSKSAGYTIHMKLPDEWIVVGLDGNVNGLGLGLNGIGITGGYTN